MASRWMQHIAIQNKRPAKLRFSVLGLSRHDFSGVTTFRSLVGVWHQRHPRLRFFDERFPLPKPSTTCCCIYTDGSVEGFRGGAGAYIQTPTGERFFQLRLLHAVTILECKLTTIALGLAKFRKLQIQDAQELWLLSDSLTSCLLLTQDWFPRTGRLPTANLDPAQRHQ